MGVRNFVTSTHRSVYVGGAPCATCRAKNRKAVEKACREFILLRESGDTCMPWATFVREYLRKKLGFQHGVRSVTFHMENHVGKK